VSRATSVVWVRAVEPRLAAWLRRFLLDVAPEATRQLRSWKRAAARIRDPVLRHEALASIAGKDFHVHGGCILATFLPKPAAHAYVRLVAAFETAVDYLDNLCDRAGHEDEADFRALHEALEDAVMPGAQPRDYFRRREGDDGGYLRSLVLDAQRSFGGLRSYQVIAPYVREVTRRYTELQALKHLPQGVREQRCEAAFAAVAPQMRWFEGAAACGSTLPTFALAYGAIAGCDETRARELNDAYFPWISGFHILLDYFIDQSEDAAHRELNFVACYGDAAQATSGIAAIGQEALARAATTSDAPHHIFAIQAMCGFYCTRRKVVEQGLGDRAAQISRAVGVDLGAPPWRLSQHPALGPLLSLYRRVTRI
jgi:tetraprenyl-beta-curcumene synthase